MNKSEITPNQAKALAALLTHRTIGEAADSVGLTSRTLLKYLADDTFKAALKEAQTSMIADVTRRLTGMQDATLTKLYSLMQESDNEAIQARSAKELLQAFLKFWEVLNLEQRLAALEAAIGAKGE